MKFLYRLNTYNQPTSLIFQRLCLKNQRLLKLDNQCLSK